MKYFNSLTFENILSFIICQFLGRGIIVWGEKVLFPRVFQHKTNIFYERKNKIHHHLHLVIVSFIRALGVLVLYHMYLHNISIPAFVNLFLQHSIVINYVTRSQWPGGQKCVCEHYSTMECDTISTDLLYYQYCINNKYSVFIQVTNTCISGNH